MQMATFLFEVGADGLPQAVIPGAEAARGASLAQMRANLPLRPKRPQRACDVGLFSDEADQLDLVSWFTEQTEE
jgi:hypothetical protein